MSEEACGTLVCDGVPEVSVNKREQRRESKREREQTNKQTNKQTQRLG